MLFRSVSTEILTGRLAEGQKLPGTDQLVRRLGLGRITVHRALTRLMQEGLVERRVGAGTFVRPRRVPPAPSVRTVGLIHSDLYAEDLALFEREMTARGVRVLQLHSNLDTHADSEDQDHLRALAEAGADLILHVPRPHKAPPVPDLELMKRGVRRICLLPHWKDMSAFDYVMPDYGSNAVRASYELARSGVKKLWLLLHNQPTNYGAAFARDAALDFCRTISLPAEACTPRQLPDCLEPRDGVVFLISRQYLHLPGDLVAQLVTEDRCILANSLWAAQTGVRRIHNPPCRILLEALRLCEATSPAEPIRSLLPGILVAADAPNPTGLPGRPSPADRPPAPDAHP